MPPSDRDPPHDDAPAAEPRSGPAAPAGSSPGTSDSRPVQRPGAGVDGTFPAGPSGDAGRVLSSEQLLQGAREVMIVHGGDIYRLRLTRHGKLILHK